MFLDLTRCISIPHEFKQLSSPFLDFIYCLIIFTSYAHIWVFSAHQEHCIDVFLFAFMFCFCQFIVVNGHFCICDLFMYVLNFVGLQPMILYNISYCFLLFLGHQRTEHLFIGCKNIPIAFRWWDDSQTLSIIWLFVCVFSH